FRQVGRIGPVVAGNPGSVHNDVPSVGHAMQSQIAGGQTAFIVSSAYEIAEVERIHAGQRSHVYPAEPETEGHRLELVEGPLPHGDPGQGGHIAVSRSVDENPSFIPFGTAFARHLNAAQAPSLYLRTGDGSMVKQVNA